MNEEQKRQEEIKLNEKGQCPYCLKKPLVYKRDKKFYCCKCSREYSLATNTLQENWSWTKDNQCKHAGRPKKSKCPKCGKWDNEEDVAKLYPTPNPEPPERKCKGIFASGIHCINPTMTPTSDYCIECYEPVGQDCAQENPENDGEKGESLKCEYCGDTEKDSMGFLCLLCLNLSQLENEFCDLFCPNFGHEDHNAKNNGCATSADNVDLGEIMKWIKTLLAAKKRELNPPKNEEK